MNREKDKLICYCNNISVSKVRDILEKNPEIDFEKFQKLSNAATSCSACLQRLENIFVEKEDLYSMGVPQSSVAVDLYGDVYLYREAAFLDRPGAKRYIIGNLLEKKTMKKVIEDFIDKERDFEIMDSDRNYLDVWDHISIKLSKQYKKNTDYGFSENNGVINLDIISKILDYNHEVHFANKK